MPRPFGSEVEERLIRYARIDTQADEASTTVPSTEKQYDLLRLLVDELEAIGAQDVTLTDYGAVLATIPATVATDVPTIAFLAHVDTSPGFNATGVKPDRPSHLWRRQHRPARRPNCRPLAGAIPVSGPESR